jgi:hypothetical protein
MDGYTFLAVSVLRTLPDQESMLQSNQATFTVGYSVYYLSAQWYCSLVYLEDDRIRHPRVTLNSLGRLACV